MSGDVHDGEMVVTGEAQIDYGTVAQVVEGKISQFYLLHSTASLEFVIPCKIIDRLSLAQEYSVLVPRRDSYENRPVLSATIHPYIKRTLVAMSERTGLSVSQVTDEVLYKGLGEIYELEELEE